MNERVAPGSTHNTCLNDLIRNHADVPGSATVTIRVYDATGTTLLTGPFSATQSGNDWCALVTYPSTLGRVLLRFTVVDGVYTDTFDTYVTVTTYLDAGTTLQELRRMVGRRIKTYRRLVATSASASGGTFTDAVNAFEDNGFFRMADVVCVVGTANNASRRARISASSLDTQTVSLIPAFPDAFSTGDQLDVFMVRDYGVRINDIDDAINDAIISARPANGVPIVQTIATAFSTNNNGFVAVPDHMTHVSGIEWEHDSETDTWFDIPPARSIGGRGWWPSISDGGVYVGGFEATSANGKLVRLRGYERAETLVDDDDRTFTDPEWVVEHAAALCIGDKGANMQRGAVRQGRADALRIKMVGNRMNNTVQIRD